jgi:hypothetical protein
MSKRGVLYIIWGDAGRRLMERSLASLRTFHPELPVHVHSLPDDLDPMRGLLEKSRMMDLSPFETTLFLDADTVVMGGLDFGFAQAERFGSAAAICECPWAKRYAGVSTEIVEYNTGVIFFNPRVKPLFDRWRALSQTLDSTSFNIAPGHDGVSCMPFNDQASFAQAVDDTGMLPAVLPLNWNFRPRWQNSYFGPIKIWHDYMDPPQPIIDNNAYYLDNPDPVYQCVRFKAG